MGWDRKRKGPASGYYYTSVRLPGKPHPAKIYGGRGAAGLAAAAEVERRAKDRRDAREAVQAELAAVEVGDRLAAELREWADIMAACWLILSGHHRHRGEWRLRNGENA